MTRRIHDAEDTKPNEIVVKPDQAPKPCCRGDPQLGPPAEFVEHLKAVQNESSRETQSAGTSVKPEPLATLVEEVRALRLGNEALRKDVAEVKKEMEQLRYSVSFTVREINASVAQING